MGSRKFTTEFRIGIARQIVKGESISAIHQEHHIKRSVLYRWRDAYMKEGEAGLQRCVGRPPQAARLLEPAAAYGEGKPVLGEEAEALEKARQRIAELERMVGKQTLQIDFLAGAFKRVKESSRKQGATGKTASTEKSGQ